MSSRSSRSSPPNRFLNSVQGVSNRSRSRRSRSESSPDSYGAHQSLPSSTSHWNTFCLEKLGICYNEEYLSSPLDILDLVYTKTGCFSPMNNDQKLYVESLRDQLSFNFSMEELVMLANNNDNDFLEIVSPDLKKQLMNIHKHNSIRKNQLVHTVAEEFTHDIANVVRYVGADPDSRPDQGPVTKALYSTVFNHFARMCRVDVLPGSLWRSKKMFCKRGVSSTADLLLKPLEFGQSMRLEYPDSDSVAVVSVVEVNKAAQNEIGLRRLTEERLATHDFSTSQKKHSIILDVDSSVLGKHGGELLMYTQYYGKKLTKGGKYRYFPGILVIGTKVIFTVLETDRQHLSEVYTVEDINSRAKIYYSLPKDILKKDDRDILIESIIRLNNV